MVLPETLLSSAGRSRGFCFKRCRRGKATIDRTHCYGCICNTLPYRTLSFLLLLLLLCGGRCNALDGGVLFVRGQDGAAADAIKAEVGKLQGLKADLATVTAAAESESTFDRKGDACCCCCCCFCCFFLVLPGSENVADKPHTQNRAKIVVYHARHATDGGRGGGVQDAVGRAFIYS